MAFRNEIIKDAPTAISSSANDFGYSLMQFLKCCKVNFQKKDPPVSQKKFGAGDNMGSGKMNNLDNFLTIDPKTGLFSGVVIILIHCIFCCKNILDSLYSFMSEFYVIILLFLKS